MATILVYTQSYPVRPETFVTTLLLKILDVLLAGSVETELSFVSNIPKPDPTFTY